MDSKADSHGQPGRITLNDAVRLAPDEPGAYRFWSDSGKVLYVGKALNLKNRIRSHLLNKSETARHERMIAASTTLDWIVVTNEIEALILEDSLIKKHRPEFNIKMRDDKRYPLIRLDIQDPYPFITIVRRCASDGALYFGPYPSAKMLRIVLRLIDKHFALRKCTTPIRSTTSRPCLHFQMKRCPGVCAGLIDRTTYQDAVSKVKLLLSGRNSDLMKRLESDMREASHALDFETAARIRDQIHAVRHVSRGRDLLIPRPVDLDVVAVLPGELFSDVECVMIRAGVIYGNIHKEFETPPEITPGEILESWLGSYYSSGVPIPSTIICSHLPDNRDHLEAILRQLRGTRVFIRKPERGIKIRLLKLAFMNLQHHTRVSRQDRKQQSQMEALMELSRVIGCTGIPSTIEAIDISEFQGREAVGSIVHFKDGNPVKSRYRRFKIKSEGSTGDPQRISEVFRRRLSRRNDKGWELPRLFVIDGGSSQLMAAMEVMRSFPELDVPILSMAKIRNRRTSESLFLPGGREVPLEPASPATLLLDRIRDEAHRFAIAYHRILHEKVTMQSPFRSQTGLSSSSVHRLLDAFGSVDAILAAGDTELLKINGIGPVTIKKLRQYKNNLPGGRRS